jgi:hypothetical protein
MSQSVVPTADKPESNSAANRMATGIATVIDSRGKCIVLSVPLVGKRPRYLSSLEKDDQCTAASATLKSGVNPHSGRTTQRGEVA